MASADDTGLDEYVLETAGPIEDDALRARIEDALAGIPVTEGARPARRKLALDQGAVLVGLLQGFADRRAILEWMQEAVIQSLGRLEDDWFAAVVCSAPDVSALLGEAWGPVEVVTDAQASEVRRSIAAHALLPAYRRAHATFRWSAGERAQLLAGADDGLNIDPARQEYPAMRPELEDLDEDQGWALASLLDGFGTEEALLAWTTKLTESSYAEAAAATIKGAYFNQPIRQAMTATDDPAGRFVRESWAAKFLLPAFNRAAREVAKRAGETVSTEKRDDHGLPPG